jgi:hypothetical protein
MRRRLAAIATLAVAFSLALALKLRIRYHRVVRLVRNNSEFVKRFARCDDKNCCPAVSGQTTGGFALDAIHDARRHDEHPHRSLIEALASSPAACTAPDAPAPLLPASIISRPQQLEELAHQLMQVCGPMPSLQTVWAARPGLRTAAVLPAHPSSPATGPQVEQFALDVEQHSLCSYLGVTCLLQISTGGLACRLTARA